VSYREIPLFLDCGGASLLGVIAVPAQPARVGVVIVVGGPQYRVGSHRQFVLLARELASAGFACLRFDYRGMGDSDGPRIPFEQIDDDVRAAIDALCGEVRSIEQVVLWGLCDGAAAAATYAATDRRVAGLALFNPWVRTPSGEAEAVLKHYYARRVLSRAFWRKLVAGKVDLAASGTSIWRSLRSAAGQGNATKPSDASALLPERIGAALLRGRVPVLIGLSGNDNVAAEFRLAASRPGPLADLMNRPEVRRVEFPGADHTFSTATWRDQAAAATLAWLRDDLGESGAGTKVRQAKSAETKSWAG
jgi:exosortase A-associated hydrolase 1